MGQKAPAAEQKAPALQLGARAPDKKASMSEQEVPATELDGLGDGQKSPGRGAKSAERREKSPGDGALTSGEETGCDNLLAPRPKTSVCTRPPSWHS